MVILLKNSNISFKILEELEEHDSHEEEEFPDTSSKLKFGEQSLNFSKIADVYFLNLSEDDIFRKPQQVPC